MVGKPKHYYYNEEKDIFRIRKKINGKNVYFGSYRDEEAAKLAVEIFEKTGWNPEDNWAVKAEVKEKLGGNQ